MISTSKSGAILSKTSFLAAAASMLSGMDSGPKIQIVPPPVGTKRVNAEGYAKPLSPAARRRQKVKAAWMRGMKIPAEDLRFLEAAERRRGPRRESWS